MGESLSPVRPADSWSTTDVRSVVHNHLWKIRGFSHCECRYLETSAKIRDVSSSATATTNDGSLLTFRIRLHPQGNKESNKDFTFFQCFCHNPSQHLRSKYKFTVLNSRGEEIATTVYTGTQQLHGYFEYIRRDLLISHILPQDELQINLELTVTFDTITKTSQTSKLSPLPSPKLEEFQVSKDLEEIFSESKLCDFKIAVGDKEISAHKVVLSARSPVFAAMLEPHTEEARLNRAVIKDIDYDVMHELLLYLYSGRSPNLSQMGLELLSAADRFQVPGLKIMADHVLRNTLAIETCCRNLAYADLYNSQDLRTEAIRFITNNVQQVVQTDGWKFLSRDHPELITELFVHIAEKKSNAVSSSNSISFSQSPVLEPTVKRLRTSDTPGSD